MQAYVRRRAAPLSGGALTLLLTVAVQAGCHPPSSAPPAPPTPPTPRYPTDIHGESKPVTWTCAGSSCPWGPSQTGHALVWPAETRPISTRLGYTVSAAMYLPAAAANGSIIACETGELRVYAGLPGDANHRTLATLAAGHTLHVEGLASREVLSVQADADFTYRATLPPVSEPAPVAAAAPGRVMQSTRALWRCNTPGCSGSEWTGAVIAWPAESAHQSNARSGDASRSVFSVDGAPLHPYMAAWAQGCKVTADSGVVLIIEWRRGNETWRETWLFPGQSHVIHLVSPEDSAMIETYDGSPGFTVSVASCTPQPIRP